MSDDPAQSAPPHAPIASDSVPWETWSQGVRFGSRYRHLTLAAVGKDYHVGVQIEELEPGRQSSPAHFHLHEEEHVLVLAGEVTLRLGDACHALQAGDYVCFPAGQQAGHCLVNEGTALCRFLVIGEQRKDEVCVYTDSNKVYVRQLGQVFDRGALLQYWDGEPAE